MKIAFIVQRYGQDIGGGSEFLCMQIAEKMSKHWDIDVLTSCAIDYMTWDNHYEPGLSIINGVNVRRFRTDFSRNIRFFNRLSAAVYNNVCPPELDEKWMREQGPYSSEFLSYLEENKNNYDAFFFFTYLYGFSFFGISKIPGYKSILVPTAHDEAPFHIPSVKSVFTKPGAFVYCTQEEQELVEKKFDVGSKPALVAGIGVDLPSRKAQPLDRHKLGLSAGPLLSYVGRIDESKGCKELCEYFLNYVRKKSDSTIQLVLAGKKIMDIPQHPQIKYLGFVSETLKQDLISESKVFMMPSPFESLSIALLEAWSFGTPSLSNFRCEVLKGQTHRSGAGSGYTNQKDFDKELDKLLTDPQLRSRFGTLGQDFVKSSYTWDRVETAYLDLLERLFSRLKTSEASGRTSP